MVLNAVRFAAKCEAKRIKIHCKEVGKTPSTIKNLGQSGQKVL